MDKILFIDGLNSIYRSCISFGPKISHDICLPACENLKHSQVESHCACGSPWDVLNSKCYGDQYLFVYNFFRNLRPLIEDFAPDKCYFVLEGHPQFRYALYPEYKANRIIKEASKKEFKDKFYQVKDIILSLIKYLPITICSAANYEADDLVGTLCDNLLEDDLTVISNDADYIQLLQRGYSNIHIFNPIKKTFMEAPKEHYLILKSLKGDKSDNIPRLVSDKKALEYCNDPDKLDKFLSIEENRANFQINRQLVEFQTVPLEEIILQEPQPDFNILKSRFVDMRFNSIIKEDYWNRFVESFNCLDSI